ncbi:hypothetical protein [Campylobacter sp.]|uniref:hypothetical protein n=1 Tax=Campylobacter sp. TaxID=205 RepID=UPI00259CFE8E|nr:hypothetical protein [Campylobacter sp.]MBQ8819160.1 hypothetical protein [Campylobacter sp.]MBQ8820680.1 hypothetical protein [Campylobacter sp.]
MAKNDLSKKLAILNKKMEQDKETYRKLKEEEKRYNQMKKPLESFIVDFQNELIQNENFRLSLEQILSSDKYENLKIKFESLKKTIEDVNDKDTNKEKKDES